MWTGPGLGRSIFGTMGTTTTAPLPRHGRAPHLSPARWLSTGLIDRFQYLDSPRLMSDFLDLHDDSVSRRVLFVVALLMITVPLVQSLTQIWPLQLSNIQWRFGAANALSSILLLPFLGLSLMLVMARGLDQTGLARAVGAASALFTLALLPCIAVFVLDAQELKTIVSTQMAAQFTNTTIRVGLVSTLFLVAYALLTIFGFSAMPGSGSAKGGKRASSKAEPSDDAPGLIVGR